MPVDELAVRIGARLVEIEEVTETARLYEGVIVAKVMDCAPVEGSDHLNVTKIDDGGRAIGVERDAQGYVQVVCGAPNVSAGITVAWLPPGSTVPETINDAEPFVLSPKNLRGVISNGMLASAKELALFEDHTGILILGDELSAGTPLTTALELDDLLLTIENKSLTHRPDTFGIVGFAREVAAIQDLGFEVPDWLRSTAPDYGEKKGDISSPVIHIDSPELSNRYQAAILSGADSTRQSPLWIQTYLSRVGLRPINAVVDVTNYLMMVSGQPLHAFDYDKVQAIAGDSPDIHVRAAHEGETLELLDGRTIEMAPGDIVIAAGDTAIGLAGAMGGANTIIDATTKNIILESATFNLYNLRSTQMRHGIFSEAITRFTKGQPAELTAPVLAEAIRLLGEWSGAVRVSDIAEAYPGYHDPLTLSVSLDTINEVLGTNLKIEEAVTPLKHVEFLIDEISEESFKLTVPYWRADIHIIEDVIEEIGRLRGFDEISPSLPERDFTAVSPSSFDELRKKIRNTLVRAGANEVLTYSFIHGDIIKKAGQDPTNSYRITNSISPDLQYYRQSLTPNLLNLVYPNIKQGYESFAIFELNKTHQKSHGLTNENVPKESNMLALTVANKKDQGTGPYYQAKAFVEYLASSLGLTLVYEPIDQEISDAVFSPFEFRRSAIIKDLKTDALIGTVGEYKKSVLRAFKLPSYSAGFELNVAALFEAAKVRTAEYTPLSKYPSSERDVCFQVANDTSYQQVVDSASKRASTLPVTVTVRPLDIYQPDSKQYKNITIRLQFTAADRTLTSETVNDYLSQISESVVSETKATVI